MHLNHSFYNETSPKSHFVHRNYSTLMLSRKYAEMHNHLLYQNETSCIISMACPLLAFVEYNTSEPFKSKDNKSFLLEINKHMKIKIKFTLNYLHKLN